MNTIKYHVRKALGLPVHYYKPDATPRAASHVPVLIGLARLFPVRRVLELGSGLYSSLLFLNRRAFPDVDMVCSYETDPAWKARVEEAAGGDARLRLELVDEVARHAAGFPYATFDLVLVDDSQAREARCATIREVTVRSAETNVVVVHDYEQPFYAASTRAMPARYCFDALVPYTGVLWKGSRVNGEARRKFKALNRAFAAMAGCPADRTDAWIEVADATLGRPCSSGSGPVS